VRNSEIFSAGEHANIQNEGRKKKNKLQSLYRFCKNDTK
jgi:hypothetical protein